MAFMQCTRTFGYDLSARYRWTALSAPSGVTEEDLTAILDHGVETAPHFGRNP
jgi:hypothetical protein